MFESLNLYVVEYEWVLFVKTSTVVLGGIVMEPVRLTEAVLEPPSQLDVHVPAVVPE
jgi:hypothetical protein